MKVTITLGPRALEYVTGIPEDELPEILSDVVERSLISQVKSVEVDKNDSDDVESKILSKLINIIQSTNTENISTQKKDEISLSKVRDVLYEKVSRSSDDGDVEDFMSLLK